MNALEEIKRAASTAFPISTTFLLFDQALTVLYSHECSATHQELITLRDAFGERDAAIQRGMHLAGRRFEVSGMAFQSYNSSQMLKLSHTDLFSCIMTFTDS